MRVIVAPQAEAAGDTVLAAVARSLAGPDDEVVSLPVTGLASPSRPLTPAEVHLVRTALSGGDPIVGYVCAGRAVGDAGAEGVVAVAVTDHVGLTWRLSACAGPTTTVSALAFPGLTGCMRPRQSASGSLPG